MRCDAGVYLKVRRWLPPLLWAGVILVATSLPGRWIPSTAWPFDNVVHLDKVVHFSMYGVFATLLAREAVLVLGGWQSLIITVGLVSAFGAADEWHQQFIPGRTTE